MPIFSRYSSGPTSTEGLSRRKGALQSLRPRRPGAPLAQPQTPPTAPPDARATALQKLRSQNAATGQSPSPLSARSGGAPAPSYASQSEPPQGRAGIQSTGRSSANALPPGVDPNLGGAPAKQPRPDLGAPAPTKFAPDSADRMLADQAAKRDLRYWEWARQNAGNLPDTITTPGGQYELGIGKEAKPGDPVAPVVLDPQAPPGVLDDPISPFDLNAIYKQQQKDLAAAERDLDVSNARARADAENRAGLGGFGLSGAAASLVGDVEAQGGRAKALAMLGMKEKQRAELMQAAIDQANLQDLAESGVDIPDNFGVTVPPANDPDNAAEIERIYAASPGWDFNQNPFGGDPDTESGTEYEPRRVTPANFERLRALGVELEPVRTLRYDGQDVQMYTDGTTYFVVVG